MLGYVQLSAPTAIVARWTRLTGGDALPVSLDTVKDFTARPRQDSEFDDELTTFVRVAQAAIENECRIQLTPGTWRADIPSFFERLRLLRRPFVEATSLKYVATDGEITDVDAALYHVQYEPQDIGVIYRGQGVTWPLTATRRDAVRVELKAGYALTQADEDAGYPVMPTEFSHAVLMTVASLEKARGDTEASTGNVTVYAMKNSRGGGLVPPEAKALVYPYIYRSITAT